MEILQNPKAEELTSELVRILEAGGEDLKNELFARLFIALMAEQALGEESAQWVLKPTNLSL